MAKAKATVRKPTHEEFVFRLRDPSASYGFSLQIMKQDRDAFWEHHDVICIGECLYPDRFKGREATVRLSGNRDLMNVTARESGNWKPTAIGYMEAGKSKFEVSISLPSDACWQVGAAMAAGTITSLLIHGPVLSRGRATLTSASFAGPEFDPIAYIG